MAGNFDLPSWLTTQTPWSGSDAFIKGSQAGAAIAANRLRAKQLYVDVQQHQQKMDLAERQFTTENEASTLRNEVLRTKLENDAADFEELRKWWPQFQQSDGDIAPPALYNENTMLKVSAEIAQKRSKVGMAAFSEFMAQPGRDLTKPEDQVLYYDLLSKYKNIPDKLGLDGVMGPIKLAEGLKRLRDEANSRMETSASKNIAAADRMDAEANATEDPVRADQLRRNAVLLRSTITAPTESIETYKDDQGNQQFRITRGPSAGAPGGLSPTVKTGLQQGLLGGERAMEIGVKAFNQMSPSSVGVQGQINKTLINEGLAQVFPGMKKDDVTEAQTLVGLFNEQAVKAITAGGDRRVSDKDMARFRAILPKMSAMESVGSARQKIATFMEDMRSEAQTDSKALGVPMPEWALTQQQVLDMYGTNAISRAKAAELLMKYHPNPEQ